MLLLDANRVVAADRLALYRCGRQADALGAYRKLRATLSGQFGIEPSRPAQPDRVLTTILNIDPAVDAGDDVLSHRGRLIQSAQASLLATFDAPGQAIRCADKIRAASTERGMEPRAGVHTGWPLFAVTSI